jgi:hypothetical protein
MKALGCSDGCGGCLGGVCSKAAVYRTRIPGHAVALCGAREVGVEVCGAGVERAEVSVLLDQPLGIVAGGELADGLADLIDALEDAAMDGLLLEGPEQLSMTPLSGM